MGRNDEYATITAILRVRTDKSAKVEDANGEGGWIPLSCMHWQSVRAILASMSGETFALSMEPIWVRPIAVALSLGATA